MNVTIETSASFLKELKQMKKRYASIVEDLRCLKEEIMNNPRLGTDLGNGLRKIRMQITSKGKGKSGGARVISFTVIATATETSISLLYIYDKAERSSITKKELNQLLKQNGFK